MGIECEYWVDWNGVSMGTGFDSNSIFTKSLSKRLNKSAYLKFHDKNDVHVITACTVYAHTLDININHVHATTTGI